jgi:hypothetical protein
VGFGATGGTIKYREPNMAADEYKKVAGTISFNGGVELYLSDSLALGADAAVYLPGGDLNGLNFSTLGGKLIYRF